MDRLGNADGTSPKERSIARKSARRLKSVKRGVGRTSSGNRLVLARLVAERGDDCGICHDPLGNLALCNVDHIIPLGRGGTDAWSNLQPAHIVCNNAKANRLQHEVRGASNDRINRVVTSSPVDATAARVTSKGTNWEPDIHLAETLRRHENAPPRMTLPPRGTPDLTGCRFGRFVVVACVGKRNPKKKVMWACRCACGTYEERSGRAISNPANAEDCCHSCRHLAYLKGTPVNCGERE